MKLYIRSMIVAPKGKVLVAADLSQAESWIVAYRANEKNMQYSLNYSDIHTDSAAALFEPDNSCLHKWRDEGSGKLCTLCLYEVVKTARYIGKRYNHASAYRMKHKRAAEVINKDSDKPPYVTVTVAESKVFQDRWHKRYNIKPWWAEIEDQLSRTRSLTTTYGRTRTFFAQWGDDLFKEATAFEPQSTVADHFNGKLHPELRVPGGLIEIDRQLIRPYKDRKIVQQGHDSCMVECPASDGPEVAKQMIAMLRRPLVINGQEFTIPTDGEIGERWGELEKVS